MNEQLQIIADVLNAAAQNGGLTKNEALSLSINADNLLRAQRAN